RLQLDPRQARADEHVIDAQPAFQQSSQSSDQFLRCGQNADIQQAVIGQRCRAQYVSTTGLSAIADAKRQQVAAPVEIRAIQLAVGRTQLTDTCQPGEQISSTAQDFFQVFRGIGG